MIEIFIDSFRRNTLKEKTVIEWTEHERDR